MIMRRPSIGRIPSYVSASRSRSHDLAHADAYEPIGLSHASGGVSEVEFRRDDGVAELGDVRVEPFRA
jgi:hypothetical protein